jgi:predicted secreted protein
LAHSKATNRLTPQTVTLTSGSSDYTITGVGTRDLDEVTGGDLVEINTAVTIVFNADGSAVVTGPNPITVESSNDATNNHTIGINNATSRIQVVL